MDDDWVVDLHDAVAVYRDYNGKLRLDQSYQMTTGEGAGWGGHRALAGGAVGGGAGTIGGPWWKDEFGIPDDFVKQIGGMVQPGDSAVFALLRSANPDVVAETFRGYGGTILSTTLSRGQQEKVENVLHNKVAA